LENVREIIDTNKSLSQTLLIGQLNPVIRGWANYHRHCAAKETWLNRASLILPGVYHARESLPLIVNTSQSHFPVL